MTTLEDVRRERLALDDKIAGAETDLGLSYGRLKEMFTVTYFTAIFSEKIYDLMSLIRNIYSGYTFVTSMFKRDKVEDLKDVEKTEKNE